VEEGSLSRTLAFACGHGYAQEEYAVQIDRDVSVGHADLRRLLPAAAAAAAVALAERCVAGIVRVVAAGRPGARCLLVTTALNSSSREHARRRQIGWQTQLHAVINIAAIFADRKLSSSRAYVDISASCYCRS